MSRTTATNATRWGDRDQRRIDILLAGEELLRDGGYAALRMRDVADGAGISLGTVYTYFATKEDLFIGIFAENVVRLTGKLRRQIETASDFAEVFIATATQYREQYQVFGRQFDALGLVQESGGLQPAVEQRLRAATADLVATLGRGLIDQGYEGDVGLAMTLLWSTVTGLANHYTTARQEFLTVPWEDAVAFAAESLGRSLDVN
ncbi:TetR/AcrR family transcriptional regulator [Gordonia sp. OPL2]|uniref:TetR/AcrR family transcriptional regulator n=1 Tax=Gordonia sp. OPL2 TaxID=2486274 RepID=UPI001655ED22|nr:TetR/AcrR family transcriptional regulator [Gordonia sp. OPL2]ROZ99313.1 TetR/AcrR family transcriptional regulator [Gordonia sp. OPL2]